jgi:hypothetical protein
VCSSDLRLERAVWEEFSQDAFLPEGLTKVVEKIGVVPFIVLSEHFDASAPSAFKANASEGTPPPPSAPAHAFVKPAAAPSRQPNIVVVLLESTFEFPRVFDVTPAMNSSLFPDAASGQLQGRLSVNAIGGGTWISEFEALTGIPSRLFGYAGFYTHVELAPYVRGSFATYLRERGYHTLALYPVQGEFYAARAAYVHYGFDEFHDSGELGIEKPWIAKDVDIIDKYLPVLRGADVSRPFFAFALTMENHSPHPCARFENEDDMPFRFVGDASARATCEMNEYIARFRSTERALAALRDALREREKTTGRPYVLAVFGDHQPTTFTGNGKSPFWSPEDFSRLRRGPNDLTFYRIESSLPSPFVAPRLDMPVVLLPTLVSGYLADDAGDVYLPRNFDVLEHCGERISIARLNAAYGSRQSLAPGAEKAAAMSPECRDALDEARRDYRKLIVMP